jgi:hypothetical protein
MNREQREVRSELREVRDSLQRISLSSVSSATLTCSSAPEVPQVGIAKTGSLKAPGASSPSSPVPYPELSDEELSGLGCRDVLPVLPFFSPATLLAAAPATSSKSPAGDALVLSARRPAIIQSAEALGLGSGWAAAVTMQDQVAQGADTVKSAVDNLTVEVAGLVSHIWRAAEIGSDLASSLATQPLNSVLTKATTQAQAEACSQALEADALAVQEQRSVPSSTNARKIIPGLHLPPLFPPHASPQSLHSFQPRPTAPVGLLPISQVFQAQA